MFDARTCPDCGSELPPRSPEGLCPRCLLGAGLNSDALSVGRGGDVGATMSLGSAGVLETLSATLGAVPRVLLRDTDAGLEPPLVRPDREAGDDSTRYRIDGEIARGGMGSVLKGRDPDLGRDVAIKVLREDLRDNADMVRRFVEEAQIGGQLQHPGIVPIYELGAFADRRPFFSMKLVKGHTLAGLLADRGHPSDGLPRFLAIFESVAQTVAYAHARGVIHRDLKPSNVMVGSFGEVQVMDWGLAKVLPRGGVVDDASAGKPARDETVIATARSGSGDSDLSHAGSVLGTPSYMAPEQARGEIDRVDERADVFALGSILCEVLTGTPAFTGRSSGEIQRMAARGDTVEAFARLDACGADRELIAVAKGCLSSEPEDRPREAGAVSGRLTGYLAGVQERLRSAERERAAAEARAEEQGKRRRVQAVLGLAFTGLLVLGGAFAWWAQEQGRARRAEKDRAVGRALEDAIARFGQAQGADRNLTLWAEARAAALHAGEQAAAAGAPAEVRRRIDGLLAEIGRIEKNRTLVASLLEIHASMGDNLGAMGNQDFLGTEAQYARAFRDYGTDLSRLAPEQGEALLGELAGEVKVEIAAALDDWAYVGWGGGFGTPNVWLFSITRLLDPDPTRDRIRDAVRGRDGPALVELAEGLDPTAHPVQTVNLLSVYLWVVAHRPDLATKLLRASQPHHPGDLQINVNLAYFLNGERRYADALPYGMAAVAVRPRERGRLEGPGRFPGGARAR